MNRYVELEGLDTELEGLDTLRLVNYKYYSTELERFITNIYIFFCYIDWYLFVYRWYSSW